jgi:hypothetical protein
LRSIYTQGVDHFVSLNELQNVVGNYVGKSNLLVAAGPLTAATLIKTFVANNKVMKLAVVGGGVWFAVKAVSGPTLGLIQEQFGYLQSLFASVGG